MNEELSPRQMRAAERMQEDEGLTGDLTDEPARALLSWAQMAAIRAAAPGDLDEMELSRLLQAIRRVARRVASEAADLHPADIAARATSMLATEAPGMIPAPQLPSPHRRPLGLRRLTLLAHAVQTRFRKLHCVAGHMPRR